MARLLRLTPVTLVGAAVLWLAADWAYRQVGDSTLIGGPLDEAAHFLTALLVLWALGPRMRQRFLIPALVASVAIDADHIPDRLGWSFLTQGTPRPYTHSLLTIALVLMAAFVWRRRRDMMLGITIGLVLHFWRDLGEWGSGVSLLWPFSDHSFTLSHGLYLAMMGAAIAAAAVRLSVVGVERAAQAVPGVDPELLVDVPQVVLHGLRRHEQGLGDLPRRQPVDRQLGDPPLARRQRVRPPA